MAKSYEQIIESIAILADAERITKKYYGELSRDLLEYVLETEDVRPINAMLGVDAETGKFVLTAANWRIGCMYFHAFVPFTSNYKDIADKGINEGRRDSSSPLVFAKKSKKKWAKCKDAITQWLADESNNIWTWQADNVTMEKPKNFAGDIQKAIVKALTGDDNNEPLTVEQVLDAVLDVEGIDAGALFAMMKPDTQEAA